MANKNLFNTKRGKQPKATNTKNNAGGDAYAFSKEHALAQLALTGCLNGTYYVTAQTQLKDVISCAKGVDSKFIAQLAVYSRESGYMKDMPALLLAILSSRDAKLFERVFERVIGNGKMLRTFTQIMRSGVTGRRSLGTVPKRNIREWLAKRKDEDLFRASVGTSPSMKDIIQMVHPVPRNEKREALYGYLLGKKVDRSMLPALVLQYEEYKRERKGYIPDVPFQKLTALNLGQAEWVNIARRAPWQMTRMNLNTFARHGVYQDRKLVDTIAKRLCNPEEIEKARVFPYQLMSAWKATGDNIPAEIRHALHKALEVSTRNVSIPKGKIYVCPDVSGSMDCPVTGYRLGSTTSVRCVDVAALMSATFLRRNQNSEVIPFEMGVREVKMNSESSIMANAKVLSNMCGGGTNISSPLEYLNRNNKRGDLVVLISDNESWADRKYGRGSGLMNAWKAYKVKNPRARLVCLDIQPNTSTPALEQADVLNVGGFSDQVFRIISDFATGRLDKGHWVEEIRKVKI